MGQNLLNEMIDKYERGNDWREETSGMRSLSFAKTALYDRYGQSTLVAEAKEWAAKGILRVKWLIYGSDIEKVFYSLDKIPAIYEITGRIPKRKRQETAICYMKKQLLQVDGGWVSEYYRSVIVQLEKGNWPEELDRCGTGKMCDSHIDSHLQVGDSDYVNLLFRCLNEMNGLHNPVYKRIFSNHCFKDSKLFERKLQNRVLTIARRYCGDIDDNMNDSQALSQLYIEEYSQELCVKGSLAVVQDGSLLDLAPFIYGMVLNSEMLKHVTVAPEQNIRKVITVENKANYMSMPYEPGTLIIFSHGYFSPKEKEFLKELEEVLRGKPVEYYHTGDLDYGGVCIFKYIRERIFPELKPYQMDKAQYDRYRDQAVPMEESSWEKLKSVEEPELQPLIRRILEEKRVIEQESFLMPQETGAED